MDRRLLSHPCLSSVLAALVVSLLPQATPGGEHVRVVLDVSTSMRSNDPSRLAPLSTVLLYDLAAPNVTLDDSFAVLPFHPTRRWQDPMQPPPTETGAAIRPTTERRDFVDRVLDLPYDAAWTYYYPGLRRAIEELEGVGGRRDVRTVVLVTDGLPEAPTRDEELRHIRQELLPRLEAGGIRLYVLAFGREADANRSFFASLIHPATGNDLGELFVDRDGSRLLPHMTEIFSRTFGYTQEAVGRLPGVERLDLEGSTTPDRVAVTLYTPQPDPPRLDLDPPPGGSLNVPDGVHSASTSGASYSMTWILSPHEGDYALATGRSTGQVAVLRPSRLELDMRPVPPTGILDRVMAGKPFQVEILVKPAAGAQGDPGPVDLSFRVFGPRTAGDRGYAWDGEIQAPPALSGQVVPQGRGYTVQVLFPSATPGHGDDTGPYTGFIEVEARRREALVGALRGPQAQRLEVHPFLAVHPVPVRGDARPVGGSSSPALSRHQEGCARFELRVDAGRLPQVPRHPLRATLDPSVAVSGPLEGATFTLDGLPLEPEGGPGPHPGAWYRGRLLDQDRLLGDHVACVRLGKPTAGDPSKPVAIPIKFALQESPYDDFDVVHPFTLSAWVAPPTFAERWQPVLTTSALLLLLLAAGWYLRYRPDLPGDLRVAVGRADSLQAPELRLLPSPPGLRRLLGLRRERPVRVEDEDRPLGSLRPVDRELFRFRPEHGVRILGEGGEPLPSRFGTVEIEVCRSYPVTAGDSEYRLRLEYGD